MAFLTTKSSIYLTALIFIGCISPFIHIIYGVRDTEGIFGYSYMSSFLNAVGRANALLCAALFIKFASSKIENEYKSPIKIGANMFLYVSCFFMLAIFIPKKMLFNKADFPASFYWISMFVLSVFSGVLFSFIQKALLYSEEKTKKMISILFKGYYEDLEEKDLVNPWKKKEYNKFIVDITEEVVSHE